MKILTTISVATSLTIAGLAGAAAAQATNPSSPPVLAQAGAAAAVPPPAADATGNAAGNVPNVPDQVQTPAPAATVVAATVTNGPIPDTPANRAKYGGPMSHTGKRTAPAGN